MIILNEEIYAEECLRKKTLGENPTYTLHVLAKYYFEKKYEKPVVIELLMDFVKKYYPRYECNKVAWEETVEKIVKGANKQTLTKVDGVWITSAELQTIGEIHDKVLERLAFTLLCIAKLNNDANPQSNGWVNNEIKEIFSIAKISCRVLDRYKKMGRLHELGLIEFPRKIDNLSCRVTYINNDSDKSLYVSDFRALGYEYLKYRGENFIRCRECGLLIRNNKRGTKKYCKDCAGYIPKEHKTITCEDCGKEFEVDSKNNRTSRCDDCYAEYRKNKVRESVRKCREKNM